MHLGKTSLLALDYIYTTAKGTVTVACPSGSDFLLGIEITDDSNCHPVLQRAFSSVLEGVALNVFSGGKPQGLNPSLSPHPQ